MIWIVRAAVLAGVLAAALLLAGCSASAPVSSDKVSNKGLSAAQSTALSDGVVSADEYEAGYQRFVACLAKEGYTVAEQPKKGTAIQYSVPSAAVDSGKEKKCYDAEFGQLDEKWQVSNEDTSDTAIAVKACLQAKGVEPKATLNDMLDQLDSIKVTLAECMKK
jgi:major membrane immunogen (membrane-anchored lipoprotein)